MAFDAAQLGFLLVILAAYFVGTVLGFGTTLLAVTFGAQLVEIDTVLAIAAPLNLMVGGYIAVRHRRTTEWRLILTRVLPLAALGLPLGLWLFNLRALGWLRLGFGAFVAVLAFNQLRGERRTTLPPLSKLPASALLFTAGVVQGLWATSGPLVVYVLGRELPDKARFRSTLATFFLPLTVALIVDYALLGLYRPEVLRLGGCAAVVMLVSILLGERAYHRLDAQRFRRLVWVLLLVGGIVLSGRALLG